MLVDHGRVGASARAESSDPDRLPGEAQTIGSIVGGRQGRRTAGAVLDLSGGAGDLRIQIVDPAGDVLLSLGPFAEEDVIARWRSVVAVSGLVPMLRKNSHDVETLARQMGRLRLGSVRPAKRLGVLTGRRPRFLCKRATGRPAAPITFRGAAGEPETQNR